MYENSTVEEKAILVGVFRRISDILKDTTEESLEELSLLTETAGASVCGIITQNREAPDKGTFVGDGKLEEINEAC